MFGSFKKIFGAAGAAALQEATKDARRDVVEAGIASGVLIMFADGQAEPEEKEKLRRFVATHPAFKSYGSADCEAIITRFVEAFEVDFGMGKDMARKEVADLTNEDEKRLCLRIAVAIAKADAEGIEETEAKAIKQLAGWLGLNAAEFLED